VKYILGAAIGVMISLMTLLPIAMSDTAPITASATVLNYCDLDVSPLTINFGTDLIPTSTSADQTITVSQLTGNWANIGATVEGTGWTGTGLTPPTMDVGQTHWSLTDIVYGSMTALTGSSVPIGATIGPGGSETVHFKLHIPDGQAADTYTQTITISACIS
jgi:hypothetical protein